MGEEQRRGRKGTQWRMGGAEQEEAKEESSKEWETQSMGEEALMHL
jgi:hypothetical protein